MKYTVNLSKKATKFIRNLSKKDYQLVINNLLSLENDPFPNGNKKLESYKNTYRVRAGNYRIIYTVEAQILTINVIDIGNRKDVYN
jgi:mRNA interferase RelE/StbE